MVFSFPCFYYISLEFFSDYIHQSIQEFREVFYNKSTLVIAQNELLQCLLDIFHKYISLRRSLPTEVQIILNTDSQLLHKFLNFLIFPSINKLLRDDIKSILF